MMIFLKIPFEDMKVYLKGKQFLTIIEALG
jgi:hypothetical protein